MKYFLKTVFLFSLPLVTIFLTYEILIRKLPNEYTTKIKNFEAQSSEIEVLILGSSHALRGINPHELKPYQAFNLAMVAQPLVVDHRLLYKYKEQLPKLKCVILSVSYFTLSQTLTEGEVKERLPYYKHFYNLEIPEVKPNSLDYYFIQFAVDFSGTAGRILRLIKGVRIARTDSLGWMGAEGKQMNDEREFIKDANTTAQRHENNSTDFNDNLRLLKDIIDFGETNGIKIILLNTPKTKWYNNNLTGLKSDIIDAEIQNLIKETSAIYLNYKDHPDFNVTDFRNSDHLNEEGAKKLSGLIQSTSSF
jgi:hypothetical protein